MSTDVIVAGAGPTGLMVAAELALGGARVVVLEQLAARTGQSKALNLQPRSAEVLASRGLLDGILAQAPALLSRGHFAGIPLDYSALPTPYPYQVGIPQARVEECLAERARSLGADIRYGEPLQSFDQNDSGVTVNGERAESGDELLDTYHAERHPVAARVLQSTRAQGILLVPDEDVTALRQVFTELVDTRALAERMAGLDHGDRLPGLDLSLLHDGRRHVVDTSDGPVAVRPDGFRAATSPLRDGF